MIVSVDRHDMCQHMFGTYPWCNPYKKVALFVPDFTSLRPAGRGPVNYGPSERQHRPVSHSGPPSGRPQRARAGGRPAPGASRIVSVAERSPRSPPHSGMQRRMTSALVSSTGRAVPCRGEAAREGGGDPNTPCRHAACGRHGAGAGRHDRHVAGLRGLMDGRAGPLPPLRVAARRSP